MRLSLLALSLLVAAGLSACKPRQPDNQDAAKQTSESTSGPAAAPVATAPTAPAPSAPAVTHAEPETAGKPFDLQSVPVTSKALPAFPYLATPAEAEKVYTEKDIEFDRVYVVAGEALHRVEGKVLHRSFSLDSLKWSPLAAHRNYETALKSLGATRVDAVHPRNDQFVERNGGDRYGIFKKMGVPILSPMEDPEVPGFEQWLLRTADTSVWLSFFISDGYVHLLTVEEKALKQLVQALPAVELSSALKKNGHVALYLNFDTDSHMLREDSLPAVDEVVKLMRGEPALKLRVEGHTDATGDAAHNRTLSLARAKSVVQAITAQQIAAERLSAAGWGPDRPLADNMSEEGKAKNRRVELVRV